MMKVTLTNEILSYITEIEHNRYKVSSVKLSKPVMNRLLELDSGKEIAVKPSEIKILEE